MIIVRWYMFKQVIRARTLRGKEHNQVHTSKCSDARLVLGNWIEEVASQLYSLDNLTRMNENLLRQRNTFAGNVLVYRICP